MITEAAGPMEPKIFTIWPFTEKATALVHSPALVYSPDFGSFLCSDRWPLASILNWSCISIPYSGC